ncbi:hypothetical protein TrCOL_g10572 [Triparma columacea]|uniref:Uncharacterized protein n=1 Tax=Triparma columacea TaxID=722753 RepID=A0A9W7GBH7_9STRA|nr:hypothetical protein TrCOL_g10572 [Triparma columacea]
MDTSCDYDASFGSHPPPRQPSISQSSVRRQAQDELSSNSSLLLMLVQQQQQQINTLTRELASLKELVSLGGAGGGKRGWTAKELSKIKAELNVPPIKKQIKSRIGQGQKWYEYLTGSVVIQNLNTVFGVDGWSEEFKDIDLKQIYGPSTDPTGKGHYFMSCMATCVITLKDGTTRMDIGEGDGIMGNLHECVCKAKKQAFTDALKRAARKYGEFLGLGMAEDDGGKRNAPVSDAERQEQVRKKRELEKASMLSQSDEVDTSVSILDASVNASSVNASMVSTSAPFSHVPNQQLLTPPKPGLASGFNLPSSASSAKPVAQAGGGAMYQSQNAAWAANVGAPPPLPPYAVSSHGKPVAAQAAFVQTTVGQMAAARANTTQSAGGTGGGGGVKRPAATAPSNPYAKKR